MQLKHTVFLLYLFTSIFTAAFKNHRHFISIPYERTRERNPRQLRKRFRSERVYKREEPLLTCIQAKDNYEHSNVLRNPKSVDLKVIQSENATEVESSIETMKSEISLEEDLERDNFKADNNRGDSFDADFEEDFEEDFDEDFEEKVVEEHIEEHIEEYEEALKAPIIKKVEDPLERFMNLLKQFVNETHFDVLEFDRKFPELQEKFSDISFSVHIQTLTPVLRHQLKFVKHVFHVMEDASIEHAKEINEVNPLAYKMAELNVRALLLHDSHENPEVKSAEYEGRVLQLWQSVSEMRSMFENHIIEAEIIIHSLAKDISPGL